MSRFWSDVVRLLTPYVPGEQPRESGLIKLNTNECPYPPSPRVMDAIQGMGADELRLYPDPESTVLRQAVATRNALDIDQVFVGNGSDEVIALAFMALLKHERPLYFPDVSYSFYPVWSELFGIEYATVPVAEDFSIDPRDYPADNGGVIIPNPNAPTGMALDLAALRILLDRSSESVVVIDEAYVDYGAESAVSLVNEYENLLVVQTLSKSRALAGLRVGYALGSGALVEALARVKNSFNSYPLDRVAQCAALAAMEDDDYFRGICRRVIDSREFLSAELTRLGFEVLPSRANFLFVTHPGHAAGDLFAALRTRGIIVRYFDKPRIDNYLRITVGSEVAIDALLRALGELLS
jgi:histidinol-phosphate aminotransferase